MKTIGIFISSTFKDMDAERDIVLSVLKPAIESALKFRHVDAAVRIVDLRWGVNTQDIPEEERESKVLNDCLDYIRTSRPFFIGFVGDRYGWIPPENRWQGIVDSMSDEERAMMSGDLNDVRSVTELEMLFGVLNDRNSLSSSFFFLRKPDVYQQMDPASKAVYCDSEPQCVAKLESLRKKIRDTYQSSGYTRNVIDYDCRWNGKSLEIDEKAVTAIVEPLVRTIMSEIDIDATDCTELDDMIRADIAFAEGRNSYYVPDTAFLNEVMSHLSSSPVPLVVKSEDGMGKTSLIAHLFSELRDSGNWLPLVHFSSKAGYDSYSEVMLKKFLWTLPGQGFPKLPSSVEAHPGMLIKYLSAFAGQQDKRVLLLIDNIQYLRDLHLVLPDLADTRNFSVVLTTNVDIAYLRDGEEARYLALPEQDEVSTGHIAARYTELAHKGLPAKVLSSLTNRKRDDGRPACSCPLWTILVLNHLVGLDLNDFAKLRNIADADDAEKISIYLQEVIESAPSDVCLLPEYLAGSFPTDEETSLARAVLESASSGYTSLERLRQTYRRDVSLFSFQTVKKAFAPLLIEDYIADVIRFDNDILVPSDMKPCDIVPLEQSKLWNYLYYKALRLSKVLDSLPEYADDRIRETVRAELNVNAVFFDERTRDEIAASAAKSEWPELASLFEGNAEQSFCDSLARFREDQDYDSQILLCISYWNFIYRGQCIIESTSDSQMIPQIISAMDSAFQNMNVITHKSLCAILANAIYFDVRSDFEKRYRSSLSNAVHYKGLQEQQTRILYLNSPTFGLTYYYASCLDEHSSNWLEMGTGAAQQKRYMTIGLEKNGTSIQLFNLLVKDMPSDAMLLDLYMTKVRRGAILMSLDNDAAMEWNGQLIAEMQRYLSVPGIARQYSFALDYLARCQIAAGRTGEAYASISNAIEILRTEHQKYPDDLQLHHSLVTMLKSSADILAGIGSLTGEPIEEMHRNTLDILEKYPDDSLAQMHLMMSLVLDMYCHAINDRADGVFELTMQTLRQMEFVLLSDFSLRFLELKYFVPALEYVLRNVPGEQANDIASRYSALRTELINRRIASPDYLPAIS